MPENQGAATGKEDRSPAPIKPKVTVGVVWGRIGRTSIPSALVLAAGFAGTDPGASAILHLLTGDYGNFMAGKVLANGAISDADLRKAAVAKFKQALHDKGYIETSRNRGSKIDKLADGKLKGEPWCSTFVTELWGQVYLEARIQPPMKGGKKFDSDLPEYILPRVLKAGGVSLQSWAEDSDRFYGRTAKRIPKPGDAVLFKSTSGHTGVVIEATSAYIKTIEGNARDRVRSKTYHSYRGDRNIIGFVNMGLKGDVKDGGDRKPTPPEKEAAVGGRIPGLDKLGVEVPELPRLPGLGSALGGHALPNALPKIPGFGSELETPKLELPKGGRIEGLDSATISSPQPAEAQDAPRPSTSGPKPQAMATPPSDPDDDWQPVKPPGIGRIPGFTPSQGQTTTPEADPLQTAILQIPTASQKLFKTEALPNLQHNKAAYQAAARKHGIPWQAIAAVHWREALAKPTHSSFEGEKLGGTGEVSGRAFRTLPDSLDATASHLKKMYGLVYKGTLSETPTQEDLMEAFLAYNRGFLYQRQGYGPERSPYVVNGLDKDHMHMRWTGHESNREAVRARLANQPDGNKLGALTVYYLLGGKVKASD